MVTNANFGSRMVSGRIEPNLRGIPKVNETIDRACIRKSNLHKLANKIHLTDFISRFFFLNLKNYLYLFVYSFFLHTY